ncbi:MAG: hypothetical protein HQL56_19385, partial [Magnetococcales bacterium]|nr:hypothetical protein [Magnetococcales bacterium]
MAAKFPTIPIVDHASQRVSGGFCSTRDAVSDEESAALAELRRLHQAAQEVKS